jgi:hypothetical protein
MPGEDVSNYEEAPYPASLGGGDDGLLESMTNVEQFAGGPGVAASDPENIGAGAGAALVESETFVDSESFLESGMEMPQLGGGSVSKRVSNAIHKFLKASTKGGSAKSAAYTKAKKRNSQRRKRRSGKARGLRAYPVVGPALDTIVHNVAKPLQLADDLVVKPVQGHGRNAIKLVAGPLTNAVKSLGKKSAKKGGSSKRRSNRRSSKKKKKSNNR